MTHGWNLALEEGRRDQWILTKDWRGEKVSFRRNKRGCPKGN